MIDLEMRQARNGKDRALEPDPTQTDGIDNVPPSGLADQTSSTLMDRGLRHARSWSRSPTRCPSGAPTPRAGGAVSAQAHGHARRLGRSPATVKGYFYDPTGDKAKTVKRRYQGACRGCGAPTQARNGKTTATSTARPPTPEQTQPNGQPSECATQCAPGRTATAACPPHTTGRAPTPAAAARKRSSDSTPATGHPPASSATCSGPGKPRARPPAPRFRDHRHAAGAPANSTSQGLSRRSFTEA